MNKAVVIAVTITSFVLMVIIGISLIIFSDFPDTDVAETTEITETVETTTASSATTEGTTKEPATESSSSAESTAEPVVIPVEGDTNGDSRAPVILPPEPSGDPCTFYNDAAFIGDSVSVMLTWYAEKTGLLGDPLFLTKESYGIVHAAGTSMLLDYNGTSARPEDALADAGVKKVFIMLGMNDVGYNTDYVMEKWHVVIGNIREKCPDIKIYIQSCTPIWTGGEKGALTNENMDRFNQRLKAVADELGCTFIDVAPYFKDNTGGLATTYCSDQYVHLNNAGVTAWTKFLIAYAEAAS